jgi:hypothetical protein
MKLLNIASRVGLNYPKEDEITPVIIIYHDLKLVDFIILIRYGIFMTPVPSPPLPSLSMATLCLRGA